MNAKMKKQLETVITSIVEENNEEAKKAFHEYLRAKTQSILLGEKADADEEDDDDKEDDDKDDDKDEKKSEKKSDKKDDDKDEKKDKKAPPFVKKDKKSEEDNEKCAM
jgi:hypothetical protein